MTSAIIGYMRALALSFCLLAVTACSEKSPVDPSPVSRELVLAPGQTSAIPEASVSIRFERVSGDSRCPGDAICIQGGNAQVEIQVLRSGRTRPHILNTGDLRPVVDQDLTIALVELNPYPFSSRPFPPEDYRATLRVTR
jgi:hypothetical protein